MPRGRFGIILYNAKTLSAHMSVFRRAQLWNPPTRWHTSSFSEPCMQPRLGECSCRYQARKLSITSLVLSVKLFKFFLDDATITHEDMALNQFRKFWHVP